ncbi:MAG: polysaccharide biosynthesis tyrosine autokinase [Nocardioides sp.]
MDLRRQLQIVRQWLWLIVASVLLAGGAAYLVSSSLPKSYTGKATMIVGQSLTAVNPDYNQLLASQRLSQTYATVSTTTQVLTHVIGSLQLPITADDLRARIVATAPANNTLIYITAEWGDPQTAANIANAVAQELIAESPAIQGKQSDVLDFVDSQLAATQKQITDLQAEVDRLSSLPARTPEEENQLQSDEGRLIQQRSAYATLLQFSSNSAANLLSVVDPALPATGPSSPRILLNTLLAALLGLLIALGIAFLVEYLDDTVKSPEDVQEVAGVATLGAIVRMKTDKKKAYSLPTLEAPRSPASEAFRTLRTNLEFASVDEPLKSILVTSAVPGEGKTTVASNVAVAFAQTGKRVILLDADMRRPGIHRVFGLPNAYGLTNLLRTVEQPLDSVAQTTPEPNLTIITTGALPPNPAELLGSRRMKEVLQRLKEEADVIVVDSPPLQLVTDAAILGAELDGTLLVVDAARTRKGAVRQATEALERVGAKLLGAVVNRLSDRAGGYYYYQYYGDYGTAKATSTGDSSAKAKVAGG